MIRKTKVRYTKIKHWVGGVNYLITQREIRFDNAVSGNRVMDI